MIDTKVKVNGKTVAEYDLINEPCVKKVNGEGPDDNGNVAVESGGPTINGGYDVPELKTLHSATTTVGSNRTNIFEYDDVHYLFEDKFNSGEECLIRFDGVECKSTITKDRNGYYHFGDSEFSKFLFHVCTLWNVEAHVYSGYIEVSDTSVAHTVEVIKPVLTPVVFADKYIPSTVARTRDVYTRNETYSSSQLYTKSETYSKAEINQNLDQNFYTKTDIYTKDEIYTNDETTLRLTWDAFDMTVDRFGYHGATYYKVSDEVIPFEDVKSVLTTNVSGSTSSNDSILENGINCYVAGWTAIVVLTPGECNTDTSGSPGNTKFTAPSAGIYFAYRHNTDYVNSLNLTYYSRYQTGLIVNSPTKKFKITVDDSGTISATEITA